jgi:hypothetical protein
MESTAPQPDDARADDAKTDATPPDAKAGDGRSKWYQFRLSNLIIIVIAINIGVFVYLPMRAKMEDMSEQLDGSGLAIKGGQTTFWMVQRQTIEVPGSRGRAQLIIGDISKGRVPLTMSDTQGLPLLTYQSVYVGQVLIFDYLGKHYHLKLMRLDDRVLHDDRAQFEIKELPPPPPPAPAPAPGGACSGDS